MVSTRAHGGDVYFLMAHAYTAHTHRTHTGYLVPASTLAAAAYHMCVSVRLFVCVYLSVCVCGACVVRVWKDDVCAATTAEEQRVLVDIARTATTTTYIACSCCCCTLQSIATHIRQLNATWPRVCSTCIAQSPRFDDIACVSFTNTFIWHCNVADKCGAR